MNTKDFIIEKLSQADESPISGEELALQCGVSRAAIWKAINSLRQEGYEISGTTNGGYQLSSSGDILTHKTLSRFFTSTFPQFAQSHIECFKEIDSTVSYAERCISSAGALRDANGELTEAGKSFHNSIIVAETQTAGRGRSGRSFVSPLKTGIYLTVIYAPKGGITNPAKITAFSAVAVCRALKTLYGIEPSIKWINDIFYNGKKVCGILTTGSTNFETGIIESAIIGIGINIEENPAAFGKELSKTAGGIFSGEGKKIPRAQLAAKVAGNVLTVLSEPESAVIEEYKNLSFIIGREVEVHSLIDSSAGIYTAKVVDIDKNLALVVELDDGTRRSLISGEVSLKSDFFTARNEL